MDQRGGFEHEFVLLAAEIARRDMIQLVVHDCHLVVNEVDTRHQRTISL